MHEWLINNEKGGVDNISRTLGETGNTLEDDLTFDEAFSEKANDWFTSEEATSKDDSGT